MPEITHIFERFMAGYNEARSGHDDYPRQLKRL